MPEESKYRSHTEKVVNERLKVLNQETEAENVAKRINNGLIEEIIIQAENELILARRMMDFKPWQPLGEERKPLADQWKWPAT